MIDLSNREGPFNHIFIYSISKWNFNSIADCSFVISNQRMQVKFEVKQNSRPEERDDEKKVYVKLTMITQLQNTGRIIDLAPFFEIQNSSIKNRIRPTKDKNLIGFVYKTYAQLEEFFVLLIKLTQIESFIFYIGNRLPENQVYRSENPYKMIMIHRNYEIHFNSRSQIYPIIERVEGFPSEYKEYFEKIAENRSEKQEPSYFEGILKNMINLHMRGNSNSIATQIGLKIISKILQFFNAKMSNLRDFKYEIIEMNNPENEIFAFTVIYNF
jgi:hypothetical protein